MAFNQEPHYLAKLGHPSAEGAEPYSGPGLQDFIAALAQVLREQGQGQTPSALQGDGLLQSIGRGADNVANFWPKAMNSAQEWMRSTADQGSFRNPPRAPYAGETAPPGIYDLLPGSDSRYGPEVYPNPEYPPPEAIAQALAEKGYQGGASQAQQQYGFNDAGPNALQGGVVDNGFADAVSEGDPGDPMYGAFVENGPSGPYQPPPPHPYASQVVDHLTSQGYPEDYLTWGRAGSGRSQDEAVQRAEAVGLPGRATRGPGQEFYGGPSLAPGPANYDMPAEEPDAAKPKAKKKGEFSDFFKVLKAAKSGDKDIKKGFKDLAKQLVTDEAGNAETTIATS